MRTALEKLGSSTRHKFTALVDRIGEKPGYRGSFPVPTILLRDVTFEGQIVADHLWFTSGAWCDWLSLGDKISFMARVSGYEKGYRGSLAERLGEDSYGYDWKLSRPTKVEVVTIY